MNTVIHVGRLVAMSVLAAAPALLAVCLLARYFDADVTAFQPAYEFDQYIYTREASTFATVGFHGGYYGGNGGHAKIGRFGPHGAAYAVVYGGLARLFGGWRDWFSPAFNLVFFTLALFACARALPFGAFAGLAFCLMVFPPWLIYASTSYQDAPQMALGLLLGLALAGLANEETGVSRRHLAGVLCLVLLAALTRPTWAVLFPAVFFCAGKCRLRAAIRACFLGVGALIAAYLLFSLTASPWIVAPGTNPGESLLHQGLGGVFAILQANLRALSRFTDNRYHTLVSLLMVSATMLFLAVPAGSRSARLRAAAVHLCNMGLPVVAYVAAYNGTGRHLARLLAAQFVLSLVYALKTLPSRSRPMILAWTLGGCLALLPATLAQYSVFVRPAYDDFAGFAPRIAAQAAAMDPALSLSLGAASPWLRTLALPMTDPVIPYLAAPLGYGLELYDTAALGQPLRAGFILLPRADAALVAARTPLTAVAETPAGTLYRNDVAFGFAASPGVAP